MKLHTPQIYKDFTCLAGSCPETCCAGWDVVIDDESQQLYNHILGPFGERLRKSMIIDSDEDLIFQNINKRCPFLNSCNLCDIYTELGETALTETCRLYPRFFSDYGVFLESGISLSCPEGARLILEDFAPMTFVTQEHPSLSDDAVKADSDFLQRMLFARKTAIILMQNRNFHFNDRLALLLDFGMHLNEGLFTPSKEASEEKLCQCYRDSSRLKTQLEYLKKKQISTESFLLLDIFKVLKSCEHRNSTFTKKIDEVVRLLESKDSLSILKLNQVPLDQPHYQEHVGVYHLFRYFLESIWTYEPLIQIQSIAFTCIAISVLCASEARRLNRPLSPIEHQTIISTFSREIEHSIPNMELIEEKLFTEKGLKADQLMAFLLHIS